MLVGRHKLVIAAHTKQGSMAIAAWAANASRRKDRINMSTFTSRITKTLPLWSIPLLSLLWSAPAHAQCVDFAVAGAGVSENGRIAMSTAACDGAETVGIT